jgi:hypothetical protein
MDFFLLRYIITVAYGPDEFRPMKEENSVKKIISQLVSDN